MNNKTKYKKEDFLVEGRLQPQSIETEEFVLGAIIKGQEYYDLVSSLLKVEHFYKEENAVIYKACSNLITNAVPVDYQTVCNELKKAGDYELSGGHYYVMSLTNETSTLANIEAHAAILVEKYLKRKTILLGYELIKQGYDESIDCFDLIDFARTETTQMLNVLETKQAKRIDELAESVLSDCFDSLNNEKAKGVPISINNLQRQTNGWQPSNLIILAARPAMGKTAVALDYAYHPVKQNIPVGFFSLEMTGKELAGRLMSKESGISSQVINQNATDTHELTALRRDCKVFKDLPLYIDDTPALSIVRLRSKAMRMKREFGIKMIIIDYLQLMDGADSKDNREQEISKISRGLKKLAKELDIPIIALSQLSRQVENRPGAMKKPQLSDLRDSGAIEQDADMIIFLLRPEYYEQDRYLYGNEDISTSGLLVKIIAKFRGGVTGEVRTKWIGETTSIENWDKIPEPIEVNNSKQLPPDKEISLGLQNNTDFLT